MHLPTTLLEARVNGGSLALSATIACARIAAAAAPLLPCSARACAGPVLYCGTRSRSTWTCGWCCCQMLLSHLLQEAEAHDAPPAPLPSVSELEEQLERSWENGFDREGASHFGGGVCGRSAWIGATDVAAMLASMGFRPRVVDFGVRQPSEGERHGRDRSRYCLNCGEKIGGEIEGVEAAWLENLACSERCVCLACVHNGKESSEMLHCLEAWRWRVPQRLAGRVETTAAGRPWTAAELLLAWVWEYFGVAGRGGGESDSAGRGGGESDSAWRESGESDSAGRGKSNSACPISGAASDPITMPRPPEFRVTRPRLPPLYLQRPGHSVVVIGAQMQGPEEGACLADAAGGCAEAGAPLDLEACRRVALWILDPGPAAPEAARALEERDAGIWRRLLLLDCRTLSCWRQFQIVWVARAGEERAAELERDAHKVVAAAEWY